jgi:hypothetical protein
MGVAGDGFLIFRPQPRSDCFLDVGESLLFVLPLGHTSRQGRAFDNHPAIFRLVERHMKDHANILPVKCRRDESNGLVICKAPHQGIMTRTRNSRAGTCPLRNAGGSGSPCSRQDSTIFRARL